VDCYEAIETRRTIRRYEQRPVPREALERIANAGRLAASAGNAQPVKFLAVADSYLLPSVFSTLAWLRAAGDPPDGERPTAYIIILGDTTVRPSYQADAAAAAQNIVLAAHNEGIGPCWIGTVDRRALARTLNIPAHLEIYAVVSLGYPAEKSVAEDHPDSAAAYRSADGVLHIPKRPLAQVLRFDKWA